MIQDITPELKAKLGLSTEEGALVSDVVSSGPAEKASIKRGDVILQFGGKSIRSSSDLPFVVASTPIGKTVVVEVLRDNQRMNLQVKTEELKEEAEAAPPSKTPPHLGMEVQEITPEMTKNYGLSRTSGVIIVRVENGSPAEQAGLAAGDFVVEIDKKTGQGYRDIEQSAGRGQRRTNHSISDRSRWHDDFCDTQCEKIT